MRFLNSRGGGRIRRISSNFMGYPKLFPTFSIITAAAGGARGARDEVRGANGGTRGGRARARGGQGWGQGGPGLGPGGAMAPLAPPLATGLISSLIQTGWCGRASCHQKLTPIPMADGNFSS